MIKADDYTKQGKYYSYETKGIWRILSYCPEPSIVMRNIITGEERGFGVSGLINKEFNEIDSFTITISNNIGSDATLEITTPHSKSGVFPVESISKITENLTQNLIE